jgi:hypothetical protein
METVKRFACCVAFLVGICSSANAIEIDELLKNPGRFNGKEVTLKGIFEVGGDDNDLWRDVRARRQLDWKHWIHVYPDWRRRPYPGTNLSPDSPANLHWVRLTAVVNTSLHGRLGDESFGLVQKKVEVLPGPRLKEFISVGAWFHNETGELLYLHVTVRTGYVSTAVAAYGVTETEFDSSSVAEIRRTRFGKLLFSRKLQSRKTYYDPNRKAYYFRITNSSIEPIPPEHTKQWKFPPTPESD